jgi:hypothetical protein
MSDDVDIEGLDGPREHHYAFAHRALPECLFGDAIRMVAAVLSDNSQALLHALWDRVGEDLDAAERLSPEGVGWELRRLGDGAILIVSLPIPCKMPEAYFVAGLLRPAGPAGTESDEPPEVSVRVFTLELTEPGKYASEAYLEELLEAQAAGTHAVLCEWTHDGQHLNYGGPVPPTVDDFIAAIRANVAGESPGA